MRIPMRCFTVYDWQEERSGSFYIDMMAELVTEFRLQPTKIGIKIPGEKKSRRKTVFKKTSISNYLHQYVIFDWISFSDPKNGNYYKINGEISLDFSNNRKNITIIRPEIIFSAADCKNFLIHISTYVTPGYGISLVLDGAAAFFFTSGIGSTSLDRDTNRRADDLGRSLGGKKEYLSGKLHDVYDFNVLTSVHLAALIFGQPLKSWIAAGAHGEIVAIKPDLFAWIVPDDIRPAIRSVLFAQGLLIATV